MNIYKLNRALHRDLGYFFLGMTIIYAISGIALNHMKDWNPNYAINHKTFQTSGNLSHSDINSEKIQQILNESGESTDYKSHYFPKPDVLKIFIDGGNISVDLNSGECFLETIQRRIVFFEVNRLHYNPGAVWMWFSDIFCVSLAFLAISGLFILKGKNGLKWRGAIFGAIGIIIPLLFVMFYI